MRSDHGVERLGLGNLDVESSCSDHEANIRLGCIVVLGMDLGVRHNLSFLPEKRRLRSLADIT